MTWLKFSKMGDEDDVFSDDVQTSTTPPLEGSMCPMCKGRGQKSRLRLFRINLQEAVHLCSDPKCTYPLGLTPSQDLLVMCPRKRKKTFKQDCVPDRKKLCSVNGVVESVMPKPKCVREQKCLKTKAEKSAHYPGYVVTTRSDMSVSTVSTDHKLPSNKLIQTKPSAPERCGTSPPEVLLQNNNLHMNEGSNGCGHQGNQYYPKRRSERDRCWLDVLLCLIIHNQQLRKSCLAEGATDSAVSRLIRACDRAHSMSDVSGAAVTGRKLSAADRILTQSKDTMWRHLHPKLRCIQREDDKTLCGLKALLSTESRDIQDMCRISYSSNVSCDHCHIQKSNTLEKRVLTFPHLPQNFTMATPYFTASCDLCQAEDQTIRLQIHRYAPVCFCHFADGLPGTSLKKYDFVSPDGSTYQVTGVIQHKEGGDGFVAWVRDTPMNVRLLEQGRQLSLQPDRDQLSSEPDPGPCSILYFLPSPLHLSRAVGDLCLYLHNTGDLWMECEDIRKPICGFNAVEPNFPLSQIYIVMWEKADHISGLHRDPSISAAQPHVQPHVQPHAHPHPRQKEDSIDSSLTKHEKVLFMANNVHPLTSPESVFAGNSNVCRSHSNSSKQPNPNEVKSKRLARMQLKFQQEKNASGKNVRIHTNGKGEHFNNQHNGTQCPSNVKPPPSVHKPEKGEKAGGSKTIGAVSVNIGPSVRHCKPDSSLELRSALSHRVMKYLPKSDAMRLALNELGQSSDEKVTSTKSTDRGKTFCGYVPKGDLKKSEQSQGSNRVKPRSQNNSNKDQSKKNVKFVLGDTLELHRGDDSQGKTTRSGRPGKSVLIHSKTTDTSPNLPFKINANMSCSDRLQLLAQQSRPSNISGSLPGQAGSRTHSKHGPSPCNTKEMGLKKIDGIQAITDNTTNSQMPSILPSPPKHEVVCDETSASTASSKVYSQQSELPDQCVPDTVRQSDHMSILSDLEYANNTQVLWMTNPPPIQRSLTEFQHGIQPSKDVSTGLNNMGLEGCRLTHRANNQTSHSPDHNSGPSDRFLATTTSATLLYSPSSFLGLPVSTSSPVKSLPLQNI